jgi:hypothetical protein
LELGIWNLGLCRPIAPRLVSPLPVAPHKIRIWYFDLGIWILEFGTWDLEFGTWIFNKLIYPSSQYLFSPTVGVKAFSSVYNGRNDIDTGFSY